MRCNALADGLLEVPPYKHLPILPRETTEEFFLDYWLTLKAEIDSGTRVPATVPTEVQPAKRSILDVPKAIVFKPAGPSLKKTAAEKNA
jgi:hypothetical protein